MKKWILLLVFVLGLALLLFRERYANYEEALEDVGQQAGYVNPTCTDPDYALNSDYTECVLTKEDGTTDVKPPTCPEGTSYTTRGDPSAGDAIQGACEPTSTPSAAETTTSTPAPPTTPTPSSTPAPSSSSTSGTYTPPPTSGKGVWGPVFPGYGETTTGSVSGDSTKTANYPVLFGGFPEKSKEEKLDLPSSASLGSDENSGMFPFSRQPGDMDLVPNPYKGNFMAPTSQKEPVPFLTDFSAFM